MAIGNIFEVPQKTTINTTLQAKSIMVVGKSKVGKSTICADASRPVFLMTENGGEGLVGFTPIPIKSWSDFKSAVTQLCGKQGRESFDTVVIDTYTNLILLLDKYVGQKMSTDKVTMDFGSDADYGKGAKSMRNELGIQLQKLTDEGYLILNVVHAEDKTDFSTQKAYIGTSLSNSLYGVAEKAVDQIIYLTRKETRGNIEYRTHFNIKGGFEGTGGRYVTDVDSVETSFANIKEVLERAIAAKAKATGASAVTASAPAVQIGTSEEYDFPALMAEFKTISDAMVAADPAEAPARIKAIIESELGAGKKVSLLTARQAELLSNIVTNLKNI